MLNVLRILRLAGNEGFSLEDLSLSEVPPHGTFERKLLNLLLTVQNGRFFVDHDKVADLRSMLDELVEE